MKKTLMAFLSWTLMLVSGSLLLTGCETLGDIFSAGVYTGVFIVVAIIVVIVVIIAKVGKK
jgi:hypothetical protein